MPATERVVAEYERQREELCKAMIQDYKGRDYFSLRCWYKDDKGEYKPGRNGLNLPVEERLDFLKLVVALFPDDVQLKEGV